MSLDNLRQKIDELDGRIVELLNERADLAAQIGAEKKRVGAPVHDPAREDEVLSRLRAMSRGALSADGVEEIYRQIIATCSDLQKDEPSA